MSYHDTFDHNTNINFNSNIIHSVHILKKFYHLQRQRSQFQHSKLASVFRTEASEKLQNRSAECAERAAQRAVLRRLSRRIDPNGVPTNEDKAKRPKIGCDGSAAAVSFGQINAAGLRSSNQYLQLATLTHGQTRVQSQACWN